MAKPEKEEAETEREATFDADAGWENLLLGIAGLVLLVVAFGFVNLLRGRRFMSIPSRVGTPELAAFVLLPALLPVVFDQQYQFGFNTVLVDLVLLATVLQVVAVALYSLFIGRDIPVPSWLQHAGIDGLKNLLAGIVAVMLGVLFLEQVITTDGGPGLLPLGIAIAAVILALSYFIRSHPGGH